MAIKYSSPATKRLRNYLLIFAACLTLPLIFIGYQSYAQLRWEMYFPYRWSAAQTVMRINELTSNRASEENLRPVADYQFYKVITNPLSKAKTIGLSPLAKYAGESGMPGFVGYFQIDSEGKVSSPLLPFTDVAKLAGSNLELEWSEIDHRLQRQAKVTQLLTEAGLAQATDDKAFLKQRGVKTRTENTWRPMLDEMDRFIEDSSNQNIAQIISNGKPDASDKRISLASETFAVGPLRGHRSEDGYLFFFRDVHSTSHFRQGFVVSEAAFLGAIVTEQLVRANFQSPIILKLSHYDELIKVLGYNIDAQDKVKVTDLPTAQELDGHMVPLFKDTLSRPLEGLRLEFYADGLPIGGASKFMGILALIVIAVIIAGLFTIYRLGKQQIQLAEDRLNFVSAVSHELRTPLTSILMYAEMLRENIIPDESKRQGYYDFIFHESERLSRLISNVLQLSRLSHDDHSVKTEYASIDTLINLVQSKVSTLLDKNAFELVCHCDTDVESTRLLVDLDSFSQIAINLIDNAIKFSRAEDKKQVDLSFKTSGQYVYMAVRDYGPGVPPDQSKKIFEMFFRSGSELTRTAPGTGIGLSLVLELARSMGGSAELVHQKPGAEFRVYFQTE